MRLVGLALLMLTMVGCARGCASPRSPWHLNPNMDHQEKYQTQEASEFFYNGSAMRLPIEGTVARDSMVVIDGRLTVAADPHRNDAPFHTGKDAAGEFLASLPIAESDALLARGQERYGIYCQPCHDKRGNGQGILTERGGVPVPSFHEDRLVALAPGEIFDTITYGKGLMSSYRYPVPAADRWAIIAYVRAMQGARGGAAVAQAVAPGERP